MPTEPIVIVGGGQSGLAAARAALLAGLHPIVLEAREAFTGSWPDYYDSLTLFSPAVHSAMPDMAFPGDPEHYPHRDEVTAYLIRYAATLDADIRTGVAVSTVTAAERGFTVHTTTGDRFDGAAVVAAAGSRPLIPELPGRDGFSGRILHVADYRDPKPFAGQRVVVVGSGNSAVQVGCELAETSSVTLASRTPVHFFPQRPGGRDVHHWLVSTGFDLLPPQWLAKLVGTRLVMDIGNYRQAFATGLIDRRPMFTALDGDSVVWADGTRETVDAVVLATGYRPRVDFLAPLGALDDAGLPLQVEGMSTTHLGLVYLGLEFQRSFSSNTLRGVGRDADHVLGPVTAYVNDAAAAVGLR